MNNFIHVNRGKNKSALLSLLLILIIPLLISSCGSSNYDGNKIIQNESVSGNSSSIEISVPNSPSTSDIFKQIVWASTGVGEGGSMPAPLGNCKSCNVENWPYPQIKLINFDPNQSLLLVAYKQHDGNCYNIGDFYATWIVNVDSSGNLDISLSGNSSDIFIYSVYDQNTGELEWQSNISLVDSDCSTDDSNQQTDEEYACNSSINTRIHIGDQARVTYSKGKSDRLRSKPTTQSTIIASLAEGTIFQVLDGPVCNGGYVWWNIQSDYGKGWIAEGTSSNWFIEPYN